MNMDSRSPVGLVGVGKMGVGLGKNLLERGFPVYALDLHPENISPLEEFGVHRASGLSEIAATCQRIITCLPSVAAVRQVYSGPDGLIAHAVPRSILIDCTSNDPVLTRELGEAARVRKIDLVDAPILRGMEDAWAGTIQLVVGGDDQVVDQCQDIFEAVAEAVIRVGELGNGHAVKALNNQVTLINHVAVCESFTLARRLGIDLEVLYRVLDASQASSKKLQDLAPRLIEGNHDPYITIDAFAKDSANFLSLAEEIGSRSPVSQAAYALFKEASGLGLGDQSPTRIATMLAEQSGTSFPGKAA